MGEVTEGRHGEMSANAHNVIFGVDFRKHLDKRQEELARSAKEIMTMVEAPWSRLHDTAPSEYVAPKQDPA